MAEPSPYPDLLHPEAACRIDEERTRLALGLAFTSGVSGGLFAEALADVRLAPSPFHPDGFEDDLFVPTFVANAFSITVDGTRAVLSTKLLTRLVTHPPSDPRAAAQRREILRELSERPELREAATSLYVRLCRLRGLVEGATGTGKLDPTRRQLDILTLLREIVEGAATGFATATSALSRIAAFGARVREGEPFRSMVDLLSYDENMATLTLAVGIGADGRIRALAIRDVATNPANPFTSSPLRRFFAKLELFVRGYSFSDGEVMARLVDAVYSGIDDELPKLVQLMGDLELLLGAMGFRDAATAAGLDTCLPEVASPDEPREMEQLWNPFLLTASTASGAAPRVVPC
ncbi:MAG: DNA mismatch repair protein, partial [Myxococcales bacterium]|nr:DNA mismatch repair protein [Myxococcales bacterium]